MSGKFVLLMILIVVMAVLVVTPNLPMIFASPYVDVDVETAYNMITNGSYPELVVLDVRNQSEYDSGHIYDAVWIPIWQLETRIGELTNHKNHEIIVYCRSGFRSATASEILDSHSFTKVHNMVGGILAWETAGHPVWKAKVHNLNTTFNYDTIQAAIDAPQTLSGHTILVEEGIYYEHIIVNKAISLMAENESTTIVDGNHTGTVLNITTSNVDVTGFAIQKSGYYPNAGIHVKNASHCKLAKNKVIGNYDGIILSSSNYSDIYENNITANNGIGINLEYSSHNTISRNNLTNNSFAIDLWYSSHCTLSGNYIAENYGDCCMRSYRSENNTIEQNTIVNNLGGLKPAIWLDGSSSNCVINNVLARNFYGIHVEGGGRNVIFGNTITEITQSLGGAIWLYDSNDNKIYGNTVKNNTLAIQLAGSNNTIFHNNFINNTQQISAWGVNMWDDGFEGNYWSNYTGVDSNHDGIGDTEHVIDVNNIDHRPLMGMFSCFNASLSEYVNVISNSTIEDFEYFEPNRTIKIHVSNMTSNQTCGFCRVTIPHALMNATNIEVIINNGTTPLLYHNYTLYDNATHRWIYFSYPHSIHEIDIIPEFPSLLILPLFMIATLVTVVVYRTKRTSDHFFF